MSPDKPQNLLIKVEGIEDTEKQIKIKGNGRKFSFWKTKQDGTETQTWAAFQAEEIKTGDHLQISFVEEHFTLKTGGAGKSNKIIWLKKTYPQAGQLPINQESANSEANNASRDERSVSIGVRGILQALLIRNGNTEGTISSLIDKAIEIDAELEKKLNAPKPWADKSQIFKKDTEELPVIQVEDDLPPMSAYTDDPGDVDVSDIPF